MLTQTQTIAALEIALAERDEQIAYLKSELGLCIDAERQRFIRTKFQLSPQQSQVLLILFDTPRLLSKYQIEERLPARDEERLSKIIDVRICQLRKILGADAIQTVWGHGYRLTDKGRAKVSDVLAPKLAVAA